jgi:hypothetical protein
MVTLSHAQSRSFKKKIVYFSLARMNANFKLAKIYVSFVLICGSKSDPEIKGIKPKSGRHKPKIFERCRWRICC